MAGLKLNLRLFTEPRFCTYSSERKGAPGDPGKGKQTLLFTEPVTRMSQIKLHADAPHKHTHHPTRVQGEQQESDSAATLSGDRSDEDDAQQVSWLSAGT